MRKTVGLSQMFLKIKIPIQGAPATEWNFERRMPEECERKKSSRTKCIPFCPRDEKKPLGFCLITIGV
jgi:hypothetical protein